MFGVRHALVPASVAQMGSDTLATMENLDGCRRGAHIH
jgi:hypothetical protein